jgi:hypothetical protein
MSPESSDPVSEQLGPSQAPVAAAYRAGMTCMVCKEKIAEIYYDVSGQIVCDQCRDDIIDRLHGGSGIWRFSKAVLFGVAAMLASAAGYAAVLKTTKLEMSIVTIAIGMLIGTAVKKGCRSRGGRLYQGLAVLLTYCAIVSACTIVRVVSIAQNPTHMRALPHKPPVPQPNVETSQKAKANQPAPDAENVAHVAPRVAERPDLIRILGLVPIIFAQSVLSPLRHASRDLIVLFIYGVGLMAAWQINRSPQVEVSGPFRVGHATDI